MSNEQSIRGEPSLNEIRADFITLHTRNFDAYMVGRSLTSEQEFYGAQFDSVIRRIQAEAWEDARRSVRAIPHWFNTDDKYGEFDLQPLGPDETSEQGAFMAVMEVLNENPYIERGETV